MKRSLGQQLLDLANPAPADFDPENLGNDALFNSNDPREEKKMLRTLSQSAQADVQKGQHVRNQLALSDGLLDIRIRIQKAIDLANRLPQPDTFAAFQADLAESSQSALLENASQQLVALLGDLVRTRMMLIAQNTAIKIASAKTVSSKRKRLADESGDELLQTLWDEILVPVDTEFVAFRDETIDKWNAKVQVASGIPLHKKFKVLNQ
eukprot:jgi/Hompol1/3448/HPOL_006539-RA